MYLSPQWISQSATQKQVRIPLFTGEGSDKIAKISPQKVEKKWRGDPYFLLHKMKVWSPLKSELIFGPVKNW